MELKVLSLGGLRHRFACSCCADDTATDRRPDASMVFISTMSLFTRHDAVKELATVVNASVTKTYASVTKTYASVTKTCCWRFSAPQPL